MGELSRRRQGLLKLQQPQCHQVENQGETKKYEKLGQDIDNPQTILN
jgi:hypothetical protein